MLEAVGGVVMTGVPLAMVIVRFAVPVPEVFVADTVTIDPAVASVGVPVMTPELAFSVRPLGSVWLE
jgi:hypothetical protein